MSFTTPNYTPDPISLFRLKCGHEVLWEGFDIFDVVRDRVPCLRCLREDMEKRLS